jgi:RNA 2',3'-cyclic 3'-phosphodiesterase
VARLFVAVWPPPGVVAALHAIERPEQPDLRYTTEDQWHVTVRFLGPVADDDVGSVAAALRAVQTCAAVDARIEPAPRRLGPTAVVLDVAGLDAVAAAVESAVGRFGEEEHRRFRGHLTIARMRRPGRWPAHGVGGLAQALPWSVREVTLVQSRLGRGPARYETLATVPLRSGGPDALVP